MTGRYYAMDRDKRWDRDRAGMAGDRGWRGPSRRIAREAIEASYTNDKKDEFVEPTWLARLHPMRDGDQVICYNFRADRARQLTAALTSTDFQGFARRRFPQIGYVCMTEYDRAFVCRWRSDPKRYITRWPKCSTRDGYVTCVSRRPKNMRT